MPYYITESNPDCSGWGVEKDDGTLLGCHTTKQAAINQMVAVSIAEGISPAGERALPQNYRPALSADVPEGRACGNCFYYDETNVRGDKAFCELWDEYVDGGYYCNRWRADVRAVGDASTPAPAKDQITGSEQNEPGSAAGPGGDIEITDAIRTALRNKVKDHNDAMAADDKPSWTRASIGQLLAVYRRGAGAFSVSHRPGMTRNQWAMGRVNAYLYLLRNGRPESANYITDNDLLPADHPKSTRPRTIRAAGDPPAVIVDIDGTLITNDGRPRPAVINFVDEYDWAVFVVTARAESERDTTVAELDAFDLDYEQLFMKPNRDDDSVAYKRSVARELLRSWNVIAAVDNDEAMRRMYARLGIEAIDPNDVTGTDIEMPDDVDEDDPVSRAVQPPAYIRDAAQKGLDYYREGRGGDGLAEGTIREARRMAAGTMSDDKVIRANAWAARHEVDLEAPQNRDPQHPDFPGAGAVAHYLWGIDPTDPGPARRWLTREAERIREEGRSMKTTVEMRAFDADAFELRAAESGDGMTFSGFAAKYDVPSLPLPFTERIAPGAFTRSLKSRNDVRMYVNHDESMVLASRRAGTLRLQDRAEGLYVEADLPPTTYGNDLSIMIKRGDVRTMSFGFSTVKDTWNDTGSERTLNEVRLHEVSVVTGTAAYPQTTAAVRNLRQIAARTSTDSEMLAEAIAALEAGDELTNDQAALLRTVVDRAAGIPAEPAQDPGLPLSVAQKQLDLAGKLIGV